MAQRWRSGRAQQRCSHAFLLHCHGKYARNGIGNGWCRISVCSGSHWCQWTVSRWEPELQIDNSKGCSCQGLLVARCLWSSNPFDAANGTALSIEKQWAQSRYANECRWFYNHLVWTKSSSRKRSQLDPDCTRKRMVRLLTPVWAT